MGLLSYTLWLTKQLRVIPEFLVEKKTMKKQWIWVLVVVGLLIIFNPFKKEYSTAVSCVDSDSPSMEGHESYNYYNLYQYGEAVVVWDDGTSEVYRDSCNPDGTNQIKEVSCNSAGQPVVSQTYCQLGGLCNNGYCVKESGTQNTPADTNSDGCVSDSEFPYAVNNWKQQTGGITDAVFPNVVNNWKQQTGC